MGTFKKMVRRMGRPVWKRIRPVIYMRMDWRIAEFLQREHVQIGGSGPDSGTWNQLVPSFLNAISTVQTFGRELAAMKKNHEHEVSQLHLEIEALRAQLEKLQQATQPALSEAVTK